MSDDWLHHAEPRTRISRAACGPSPSSSPGSAPRSSPGLAQFLGNPYVIMGRRGVTVEEWPGNPACGKAHEQIREHLLAVLAGGMPRPVCGSPMCRHHMLDLHHAGTAGR